MRSLPGDHELDDDRGRVDVAIVHRNEPACEPERVSLPIHRPNGR